MPALNDELAEKAGLKTLDELKTKIEEGITKNIEEEAENEEYRELLRKLSEQYPFDIPLSLIEGNVESRLEEYKKTAGETKNLAEIKNLLKKQIENELRLVFIFRKTAADHHIEVESEDIHAELNRQISLISSGRSAINFQDKPEEVRERLQNLALDRKIKSFILERVTFTEE